MPNEKDGGGTVFSETFLKKLTKLWRGRSDPRHDIEVKPRQPKDL